jgi:hypothetical protein
MLDVRAAQPLHSVPSLSRQMSAGLLSVNELQERQLWSFLQITKSSAHVVLPIMSAEFGSWVDRRRRDFC